jgi:alginate O-acetyltransferase complex protein AlgI
MFSLGPERLDAAGAWLGLVCYAIQIYFDFSGYSDMAIGLARMFGFHFLENFDHPYFSRSITEFWRRWHISLSRWFRDYLYVPLGGNRGPPWRTYLNLSVVFLLCGLWHGASWTFVLWGRVPRRASHRRASRLGAGARPPPSRRATRLRPVLWVALGWVLFRAPTLPAAATYLRALAGLGAPSDLVQLASTVTPAVVLALTAGVIGSTPFLRQLRARRGGGLDLAGGGTGWLRDAAVLGLLFLSVLQVASGTYNPFIYFRF